MWGEAQDGRRPGLRGAPLPDEILGAMERSFGQSFSDVRVHEGSEAQAVGARAYAQGTNLYFAPEEFQPGTEEGRRLIGHELTHIVQQRHGRVSGLRAKGGVDGDVDLEAEADRLGVRAARGETVVVPGEGTHSVASAPIQRKVGFEYEIGAVGSAQVFPRGAKEQKHFVAELERARKGKDIKSTFTDDMHTQPRDYLDTGELVDVKTGEQGVGDARFLSLTKKEKILIGDGFALEADEGNALQGGHGAFSNIEFVTDVSYLKGAAGDRIGYAKSIAPLMARTDFATLFRQLPDEELTYFHAYPAAFEAIVADASGLNMSQDMFPNGIYKDPRTAGAGDRNALAGLTRATWVGGIAAGVDFLTAKNFNKGIGKSPADPNYDERKDDLESMGALGSQTENAGGADSGIFEMRSLGGLSGKLNYKQLAERLADLYVYVTQLNESGPSDQVTFEKSV